MSNKYISPDQTTGELRVSELHSLYGEVERPARFTEAIVYRARNLVHRFIKSAEE